VFETGEPDSPDGYIKVEPGEGFSVSYDMDLPEPVGKQTFEYRHDSIEGYQNEIAPARTFSFIWELEALEEMGLGEGGRWGNFILIDSERVVNTELRFPDEFVRHKILDIIGDMYLLGRPIEGRVSAFRSGHRHNVGLVRRIAESLL
jgi:UDP-3-O-acyl-N-acetylglucosamine deacetylase